MTTIRRIVTSKIDGSDANNNDTNEIRPFGETNFYVDGNGPTDKLVLSIHDGVRTHLKSKVLSPGRLYGADADAGDSSNADTIKLIPDAELYNNGSDQYIIVDPTGGDPGHIHLRAGGTQDASTADLYLGGELTCVRVSDTSDSVTIRTTNIGDPNITMNWTFDNQGYLYFPGIGSNRIGESEPGMVLSSDVGVALIANSMGDGKTLIFDVNGKLKLNNTEINAIGSQAQVGSIINVPLNAAGDTVDYTGGASVIEVPTNGDTNLVTAGWVITFNGGARRTVSSRAEAGGYTSIYYNDASPGGTLYPLTIESADYAAAVTGTISLTPNPNIEGAITWNFSETGTLTLPNNAVIRTDGDNVEVGNVTNFNVEATGVVNVYTDAEGTGYQWQFGDDGSLTLPGDIHGAPLLSPSPTPSQIGRVVNITPADDASDKAFRFSIDQLGETFSRAYLQLPTAEVDKQVAAVFPHSNGKAGYIFTQGTNATDDGMNDAFNIFYNAGDIKVTAMTSLGVLRTWKFGDDGSLTFPDDTVQTTAWTGTGTADTGNVTFDDNTIQGNTLGTVGTQITVNSNYLGVTSQNSNVFALSKTTDTNQVQIGWIIRGTDGIAQTVTNKIDSGSYWSFYVASGRQTSYPITIESSDYQLGGGAQLILAVDPGDSSVKSWTFDSDGSVTFPGGMTIETEYGGSNQFIIDGSANYVDIRSTASVLVGYNSTGNVAIGNPSGGTFTEIVSEKVVFLGQSVPATSIGVAGDSPGRVAFDATYIYYCTGLYNGASNIWKRVAWSGDTW